MKRHGSISCLVALLLLSSCAVSPDEGHMPSTLSTRRSMHRVHKAQQETQEQTQAAEEVARLEAEARAAAEEQARLEEEARIAAEEHARQEAETRKLLAEQAAHQEAEARRLQVEQARKEAEARKLLAEQAKRDAETRKAAMMAAAEQAAREAEEQEASARAAAQRPQLMTSRGRRGTHRDAAPDTVPSGEQQAAALEMLAQQEAAKPKEAPKPRKEKPVVRKKAEPRPAYTADVRTSLRNRNISPANMDEEDDGSTSFSLPNSVELRGLRSPSMRGQLPMNIDGKIIKNN